MRPSRLVLLLALLCLPSVASAVPANINHQGLVLGDNGLPMDGNVTLTLSIYDQQEGGDLLWTQEEQYFLQEGYYYTQLRDLEGVFGDGDRYLGISVDHEPELSPRHRIVSVPYALVAANAVGDITPASVDVGPGGEISLNGSVVIDAAGQWQGAPIDAGNIVGQVGDADTFDGHALDDFIVLTEDDATGKLSTLLEQVDVDAATLQGLGLDDLIVVGSADAPGQVEDLLAQIDVDAATFDGAYPDDFLMPESAAAPGQLETLLDAVEVDATYLDGEESGHYLSFDDPGHELNADPAAQVLDWLTGIPAGAGDPVPGLNADQLDGLDGSRYLRFADGVDQPSAQVLAWLVALGDPLPLNATLLDGVDSSEFLRVGAALDADTLDGHDSVAFLRSDATAVNANLLDGLDSAAFLRTNGKAADAERIDGLDSSLLMRRDVDTGTAGALEVGGELSVTGLTELASVQVAAGAQVGVGVVAPQAEVDVAGTVRADRVDTEALVVRSLADAPANPAPGTIYFAGGSGQFMGYTGTEWVVLNGAARVGVSPDAPGTSCQAILDSGSAAGNGAYWIQPVGAAAPFQAYCDMSTDGGGYTLKRFDDGSLAGNQDTYRSFCAQYGMQVVVPRTRSHALAIRDWNGGTIPNLVNVFPKTNGATGLENWTGRCSEGNCSFWMSHDNNANCAGFEPNGDNNVTDSLYRHGDGCDYGNWNDGNNTMAITGWVICSTNDKRFNLRSSCKDILDAGESTGSGKYLISPVGGRIVEVHCDMVTDGGGYTMARFDSNTLAGDQTQYQNLCGSYGMEVFVPRTQAHAYAVRDWNSGTIPNLANVFPKWNGATGLSNWEGRCQGQPCSFWLSNSNNANCAGNEPNGDNNVAYRLYRHSDGCDYGAWNDASNRMAITGWVICSTNDL